MKRALFFVVSVFMAFAVISTASTYPRYKLTDLGNFGGIETCAYDINNAGQVVGYSRDSYGQKFAFLWQNGVMTKLSTSGTAVEARAINNKGQIMGFASNNRIFLWENGLLKDWGPVPGYRGYLSSMNDSGVICGTAPIGEYWHAYTLNNGVLTDLGILGEYGSHCHCINNDGVVAGCAWEADTFRQVPVIWRNNLIERLPIPDGVKGSALGINDKGEAVGWWLDQNKNYGLAMWKDDVMYDLGSLGGNSCEAMAINENGVVVGSSRTKGDWHFHACVWENGILKDLNDLIAPGSGWLLAICSAVNNAGQIVGVGIVGEQQKAFILDPMPLEISIDIKPGNPDNKINLKSKSIVPVAVLTTPDFDVAEVDTASLSLAGAAPEKWHVEDVDIDGDMDLLLHFRVQDLQLTAGSIEAVLSGTTLDGDPVEGKDSVSIVKAAK